MIYISLAIAAILAFASAIEHQAYVAAGVCAGFAVLYSWLFQKYILIRSEIKRKGS